MSDHRCTSTAGVRRRIKGRRAKDACQEPLPDRRRRCMGRVVLTMLALGTATLGVHSAAAAQLAPASAAYGAGSPAAVSASLRAESEGGIDLFCAGRLRLQAQRVAKLYLQIGLGINAEPARRQLAQAIRQSDTDLAELLRRLRDPVAQKTLTRVDSQWSELKAALALPWSPAAIQRINALAETQSITAGRLALEIEEGVDAPVARLLDLTLRQSMLAQRLARIYLFALTGDNSRGRRVDAEQTRKEFTAAFEELTSAHENTEPTREALDLVKVQWVFFDQAVSDMARGERSNPVHVATTSERILESLNEVATQFAASARAPARRE
ncbi:hypothetical protein GHK24_08535 [Rhodocyclus tenuis]|uniref:NarX-like N-terminal domain-containing protein n=2 Tax=Rhodocyclus TaxID=1064 RepID=A0A6L5JZ21_RHOTE|nr:hypothetical protein [Rhodocyclus gracilis]